MTITRILVFAAGAVLASGAAPEGWFLAGNKPANYDTGVDSKMLNNAKPSAYLRSKDALEPETGFGTLMQQFNAKDYVGKRVRFSAYVKGDDVARWAGLWMRVDGDSGSRNNPTLAFDNMQDRAIKGTTGWQRYEVVLDVPEGATGIFFGILLDGPGTVWLNSTNIEVVGPGIPTTGRRTNVVPEGPRNLGFDK